MTDKMNYDIIDYGTKYQAIKNLLQVNCTACHIYQPVFVIVKLWK